MYKLTGLSLEDVVVDFGDVSSQEKPSMPPSCTKGMYEVTEEGVPEVFICAISCRIMITPVRVQNGKEVSVVDKSVIDDNDGNNPYNRQPVDIEPSIDRELMSKITAWRKSFPELVGAYGAATETQTYVPTGFKLSGDKTLISTYTPVLMLCEELLKIHTGIHNPRIDLLRGTYTPKKEHWYSRSKQPVEAHVMAVYAGKSMVGSVYLSLGGRVLEFDEKTLDGLFDGWETTYLQKMAS